VTYSETLIFFSSDLSPPDGSDRTNCPRSELKNIQELSEQRYGSSNFFEKALFDDYVKHVGACFVG